MCRDCADHDGTCPHTGEPCEPVDKAHSSPAPCSEAGLVQEKTISLKLEVKGARDMEIIVFTLQKLAEQIERGGLNGYAQHEGGLTIKWAVRRVLNQKPQNDQAMRPAVVANPKP